MKFILATHNPGKAAEMAAFEPSTAWRWSALRMWASPWTWRRREPPSPKTPCSRPRPSAPQRICLPSPMIPASAWMPSTEDRASTLPATVERAWMTRDAIPCCCRICAVKPPGRPTLPGAIACALPNGDELTAEGRCDGTIAFAPMGEGGFGYDPVFFVPEKAKTFGQLTAEEKSAISHRGKALKAFSEKLATYLGK